LIAFYIVIVNSIFQGTANLPEIPDPDPLIHLPGYALRRAAQAMMAKLKTRLEPLDLRVVDATVLMLIADRTDLTSSEIGKLLDIQRANMVPLLNRLEAAQLVERKPIDRKSQAIVLTAQGRKCHAEVLRITGQFEHDLLARIPSEHRAHLVPALQALLD